MNDKEEAMKAIDHFAEAEKARAKAMLYADTLNMVYDKRPKTAHDPVNHPKHYTYHPSGIECIQVTEHMNFCRGNAVKYIWRAGEKGDAIEDLKKAIWCLRREIARLEARKPVSVEEDTP